MNKEIQTLVALQLISKDEDVTTHEYIKNKIVETKVFNKLELLKIAIKEGLDIMIPLDEEQLGSNISYSMGTDGKITFVEKMMDSHGNIKNLVDFLADSIKKEDLKKAHPKFMSNIYNVFQDNGISMKKMFELGFEFKQGSFDEENKAASGDLDFFECCCFYQKDFDFKYKYSGDYTLKDSIEDSIKYKKENNLNTSKEENLLNFIEKVIIKQNFESKKVESSFKEIKVKL